MVAAKVTSSTSRTSVIFNGIFPRGTACRTSHCFELATIDLKLATMMQRSSHSRSEATGAAGAVGTVRGTAEGGDGCAFGETTDGVLQFYYRSSE